MRKRVGESLAKCGHYRYNIAGKLPPSALQAIQGLLLTCRSQECGRLPLRIRATLRLPLLSRRRTTTVILAMVIELDRGTRPLGPARAGRREAPLMAASIPSAASSKASYHFEVPSWPKCRSENAMETRRADVEEAVCILISNIVAFVPGCAWTALRLSIYECRRTHVDSLA